MRSIALALLLMVVPSAAFGQAWTRDQGRAYLNVSFRHLSGDRAYGSEFEAHDLPTAYTQTSLGLYGELGIVDQYLMATVSDDLYRRNQLDAQGATSGFGDTELGLWSGLITTPFRLTTGVKLGLPTGDRDPKPDDGADDDARLIAASLPTGDGEVDITPTIVAGYGFGGDGWPLEHYLVAAVGYGIRTKGFADDFQYKLELGTKVPTAFLDRFWLTLRFFGTESLASNAEAANNPSGFGTGNGVTFTSASAELYGRIYEGLGASVAVDTAFRARGIIAAMPIKLALSYEL